MGANSSCLRNVAIMRPKDDENEMKAGDDKMIDDVNKDDTEDRLAAVGKTLAGLKNSISDPNKRLGKLIKKDQLKKKGRSKEEIEASAAKIGELSKVVFPLMDEEKREAENEKQLRDDLRNGKYFAKSADIFPKKEAFHVKFVDINGKSKKLGGGSKGMRDARQNIVFVPNPHDQFDDDGCNWVVYPIMSVAQMLNWAGEKYDVAIWAGEKIDDVPEGAVEGHWIVGTSKRSAEAAEKRLSCRESRTTYGFAVHLISER